MLSMLSGAGLGSRAPPSNGGSDGLAPWHVVAESCAVREAADPSARVVATLGRGGAVCVDERNSLAETSLMGVNTLAAARARRQHLGMSWLRVRHPVRRRRRVDGDSSARVARQPWAS